MSKKGRKQVFRPKNERFLQKSEIKQRNMMNKTSEALKASEVFCCACGGGDAAEGRRGMIGKKGGDVDGAQGQARRMAH